MTETLLLVVYLLCILWFGASSVLSFWIARKMHGCIREAPKKLRGVVRSTAARHGAHGALRLIFVAVLLDLMVDEDADFAVPFLIVTFSLWLGVLLWNFVSLVRNRGDPRVKHWTSIGRLKEDQVSEHDELASQPYEDPGWLPVFRRMGLGRLHRESGAEMDGVVLARLVFLLLLLSGVLILFVLTFIIDRVGAPDPVVASVVIVLGIGGIAAGFWTTNRKLDISNASQLAESYRTNFFLGFALNQAPLLQSFVLCFIQDELWPYIVALPMYVIGMAIIAPSRRNLDRRQQDIQRQGSTLSLGRALSHLPRGGR